MQFKLTGAAINNTKRSRAPKNMNAIGPGWQGGVPTGTHLAQMGHATPGYNPLSVPRPLINGYATPRSNPDGGGSHEHIVGSGPQPSTKIRPYPSVPTNVRMSPLRVLRNGKNTVVF